MRITVYAQTNDRDVFHYRYKSGIESNLIMRLRDGRWAAIEVNPDKNKRLISKNPQSKTI